MSTSTQQPTCELLSPAQVARRLGVHRASVYRWIHTGELPAVRLGHDGHSLRVHAETLDGWLTPATPRNGDEARPAAHSIGRCNR